MYKYMDAVRVNIPSYEGHIAARADYYGKIEVQYLVEGIDKTGNPISEWVPESRLKKIENENNKTKQL